MRGASNSNLNSNKAISPRVQSPDINGKITTSGNSISDIIGQKENAPHIAESRLIRTGA